MKQFCVYIMAGESGTLYIGVTSNLQKRLCEHKTGFFDGFSKKYNCTKLVFYEFTEDSGLAIEREKQLKKWRREKKESLIKTNNPGWLDLSSSWEGAPPLRSG